MLKHSIVVKASLRFCKAQKNYSTAVRLLDNGHYDAVIDRVYLCMFHAARALLIYDNIDLNKPDKIIKSFREEYILQRYHDPKLCKIFEEAQSLRHSTIFDDDFLAHIEHAKQQLKNAEYFLEVTGTISGRRLALEYKAPDCLDNAESH